jgi:hypothetical protein
MQKHSTKYEHTTYVLSIVNSRKKSRKTHTLFLSCLRIVFVILLDLYLDFIVFILINTIYDILGYNRTSLLFLIGKSERFSVSKTCHNEIIFIFYIIFKNLKIYKQCVSKKIYIQTMSKDLIFLK